MKKEVRAAIAYIVLSLNSKSSKSDVYDYGRGKHMSFSGNVSETRVDVYDYGSSSHISGNSNGNTFSLFHYGNGNHWNVNTKLNSLFKVIVHLITCILQVLNNLMIHEFEYY